jgi:hypothetical protein
MKIRNGFISNSSSSSFVIGKMFMTPEQLNQFNNWRPQFDSSTFTTINDIRTVDDYEMEYGTILLEADDYFYGEIDNYAVEIYKDFLISIGVNPKHIAFGC